MQLQSGCATLWPRGKRGPSTPTAARIIASRDTGRESAPETVGAPRCRMTLHGVSTARLRLSVKPGASSESSLRCRSLLEPDPSADCGRLPLLPCQPGLIQELVSSVARRYKMALSGGLMFRAAGPVGVQNVTFAGVFVPQEWNQHADQSASRLCPVGVWIRLYHRVPLSFHRFDTPANSCTRLGHRRRTPNSRAPKDGARKASPSAHYILACLQRDSMTARTTRSSSTSKKVAYRRAECIGVSGTPHSSPPNQVQVQMGTTLAGMDSHMNPPTRAYLQPFGPVKLIFRDGTQTAEQAAPPSAS